MAPTKSILLVPPLIKYSAGPLLGPALLQSAAKSRGHVCKVIDLNAQYIQPRVMPRLHLGKFVGDHDKPKAHGPCSLSAIEERFLNKHILPALDHTNHLDSDEMEKFRRRVLFGFLTHHQVEAAAISLADSGLGRWIQDIIAKHTDPEKGGDSVGHPEVIGVSLLHSGQILPAAAITQVARQLWPEALVVWGGPHISGLGKAALERDIRFRAFAADVFVTGHAERTFLQVLDQVEVLKRETKSIPKVLTGESGKVLSPVFDDLDIYDKPLTLPAQSTLGCAYGRCTYCTYPSIEGTPRKLDLLTAVGTVVDTAQCMGNDTSVSIKDSLVIATRLSEIGDLIQGRVKWSACTKLSRRLDRQKLMQLSANGLATLELGLESLLPQTQRRIDKMQPESRYHDFVRSVAEMDSDLSLVVNYMVGFPWENKEEAHAKLEEVRDFLMKNLGPDRGTIELNTFELERLSAMARFPDAYGIDPFSIMTWPWASVLEVQS
mmetsp:Transcript_5973/g.17265  ORF Transcript_5973/g.17265 Transcript_5973/m.17265 type:complete len:491 (+) Transcript_5973:215-1687(+)